MDRPRRRVTALLASLPLLAACSATPEDPDPSPAPAGVLVADTGVAVAVRGTHRGAHPGADGGAHRGSRDRAAEPHLPGRPRGRRPRRRRPEARRGPRAHQQLHVVRRHVPLDDRRRRDASAADQRGAQRADRARPAGWSGMAGRGARARLHRPGLLRPRPGHDPRARVPRPARVRRAPRRLPQPRRVHRRPARRARPYGWATPPTSPPPCTPCATRRTSGSTPTGSRCSAGRWAAA